MSGGVDSAVALLRAGPKAIGVTLRLWLDPDGPDASARAARPRRCSPRGATCHARGLPHVTLDAREDFRRAIVDAVRPRLRARRDAEPVHALQRPLPLRASCSRFARRAGAARLATGHYARIVEPRRAACSSPARPTRRRISRTCSRRVDPARARPALVPARRADEGRDARRGRARRPRRPPAGRTARRRASSPAPTTATSSARSGLTGEPGAIVDEDGPRARPPRRLLALHARAAPRPRRRRRPAALRAPHRRAHATPSSPARATPSGRPPSPSPAASTRPPAPSRPSCAPARPLVPARGRGDRARLHARPRRAGARRRARPDRRRLRRRRRRRRGHDSHRFERRPQRTRQDPARMGDRICLTVPRVERHYFGVAHLVLGGVAMRQNFTFEALEDLQLAVEELLGREHGDGARDARAGAAATGASRRASARSTAACCATTSSRPGERELGLRRVLDSTVDSLAVETRDDGDWVAAHQGRRHCLMPNPDDDRAPARATTSRATSPRATQLIEQYMSLVRSLARRYAYRGEQLDDLVQIGAIGLIKAIDRFDLEPRRRAHDLRDAEHHRRDQAALPRQGLGGARAARAPGARRAALEDRRAADRAAQPLADDRRDRQGGRGRGGAGARGDRERPRILVRLASRPASSGDEDGELDPLETIGTEEHEYEVSEDRAVLEPGFTRARRARAADPPPALLRGADAVADRGADRHLADARLAPDPPRAREDPRGDRRGRGRAASAAGGR